MRKLLFIIFSLILFLFSFQIRQGFLASKDYNEGSDASEYLCAAANTADLVREITSLNKLPAALRGIFIGLDTHSAPTAMAYFTAIDLFFPGKRQFLAAICNALIVVVLFYVAQRWFTLGIALLIAFTAAIYTPLYAFIYSHMPESFGAFFVPAMMLVVVYLANRSSRSWWKALLVGLGLGLVALYRIELRWVGIPFIVVWYIIERKKKPLLPAIVMLSLYLLIVWGWLIASYKYNPNPYYSWANTSAIIYNAYNFRTLGWQFNTAPTPGWKLTDLLKFVLSQGPFRLIWLQMAQVIRLWTRPATVWIGEYFLADTWLFRLHAVLIMLALVGLRKIFFQKTFLLLAIPLVWGSIFSYAPEELRRQVPLVGIMLLFAAAGIAELKFITTKKAYRRVVFLIIIFSGLMLIPPDMLYGVLSALSPGLNSLLPLRIAVILGEFILVLVITLALWHFDSGRRTYGGKGKVHLASLIPLAAFTMFALYQMYDPIWHTWYTSLLPSQKIEQTITIWPKQIPYLKPENGYLLIDLKDTSAAKNLKVTLNGDALQKCFTLKEAVGTIDRLVVRQFQRGMPRLGWGQIEDEVTALSIFPNVHYWLIFPLTGEVLRETNLITVQNTAATVAAPPLIYGDYYSSRKINIYEGPTARIFQGPASFCKFQVDADLRLPEKRQLFSRTNSSKFYTGQKVNSVDLSNSIGLQKGRYRIFFLFPYKGGDPEDIF